MKTGEEHGKKFLEMEDAIGGHYGIVLESKNENRGTPLIKMI